MRFKEITFVILLMFYYVENKMISVDYVTVVPRINEPITQIGQSEENLSDTVIGLKPYDQSDQDEYELDMNRKRINEGVKKSCAIVVLSNIQHPNMQSLLRKYRYDANGILIPSSVKYFVKMAQGLRSSPHLVPLNDQAFSPSGGFVRYYKEVPPIPHSW